MQKIITAMDARKNFGQILNEAALRGDDFIVERAGKAMVAIVSMEKYEIMRQNREEARIAADIIKEKMKGADIATTEVLISEAISDIRTS
ncbi:MAG: type II toxin-antitoxin system Phd/YefM family antitoxin [Desulfatiglans sp.]|jgi:prevent-host-death family protein|nr:type II toxin-antitoxin system Phd/YefM family antitoxin [Desulfatiglans sp.]